MTVDYEQLNREARANWMTVPTMAERYAIPAHRIRKWIAAGKLEAYWIDGQYRVDPATMDAHLASRHKKVTVE